LLREARVVGGGAALMRKGKGEGVTEDVMDHVVHAHNSERSRQVCVCVCLCVCERETAGYYRRNFCQEHLCQLLNFWRHRRVRILKADRGCAGADV